MLVDSHRLTSADREHWLEMKKLDALYAESHSQRMLRLQNKAIGEIGSFFADSLGYIGVSWGKDSVVVADLAMRAKVRVPIVSVRAEPLVSPECNAVRDAFLRIWPHARYEEVVVWCTPDPMDHDGWHQTGTLEQGFKDAALRFGCRYASGVRGEESSNRNLRMLSFGTETNNTLAPIGWWKSEMVFAYLCAFGLPVHPAYAMTFGGTLDRARNRVSFLTLRRGEGKGKREWEEHYYRDRLHEIRKQARMMEGEDS